ncbi:hypothetical protein FHR32_005905 [Streptosporangium album]|uniref:Uncharacterized protein n=1 Tax=Streptosporangium album TaxID=47479 RepID=A0A7W7S1M8_9ACTN|nr:hypothetical protein [Streptosporangium album]MBB4941528.1 hypothetical protein [Streptosporangium album]
MATTNACTGDIELTAPVHAALERRGLRPGEHAVDAGYISAALIVSAQSAYGIELLGPVGIDTTGPGQAQAGLTQEDFVIENLQRGDPGLWPWGGNAARCRTV